MVILLLIKSLIYIFSPIGLGAYYWGIIFLFASERQNYNLQIARLFLLFQPIKINKAPCKNSTRIYINTIYKFKTTHHRQMKQIKPQNVAPRFLLFHLHKPSLYICDGASFHAEYIYIFI